MKLNKTLVALAVAGVVAAPVAMAEVTVYGQARMSLDSNKNGDNTGNSGSALAVSSNASRLGFKGSEDLGDGLKAIWQYEREVFFDNGAATSTGASAGNPNFKARNSFLGLNGGFGTVLLGTHDTPYKLATQSHDIMVDTRGDYNAIVAHDTRADNVIAYLSPDFSGVKFAAGYIPSYTKDDVSRTKLESKQKGISANVTYGAGPLELAAAYEKLTAATTSAGVDHDDKAVKLGAAYKIGDATRLGLVWDKRSWNTSSKTSTKWLNVSHTFGTASVRAGYGWVDETTSGAKDGGKLMTVGYFRNMGKNVEIYGLVAKVTNDDNGKYSVKGVSSSGVGGKDVTSVSAGMNLKF